MKDLTHTNTDGSLHMVDVGEKEITHRIARASGVIDLKSAFDAVKNDRLKKGSVIECARVAGVMAAKQTSSLIPLCHPIALDSVDISFQYQGTCLHVEATANCHGRTGVEMEALTAASVALLTVYDMAKGVEKGMEISDIRLEAKSGGRSGDWTRDSKK